MSQTSVTDIIETVHKVLPQTHNAGPNEGKDCVLLLHSDGCITIPHHYNSATYSFNTILVFGSRRFSILLHGSILFIPELPFHFLFRLKHTPIIFKDIHSEDQGSSKNGFEDRSIQTTSGCRHGISFPFEQHRPDINVLEVSTSLTNA